jgi:hypothetical protein
MPEHCGLTVFLGGQRMMHFLRHLLNGNANWQMFISAAYLLDLTVYLFQLFLHEKWRKGTLLLFLKGTDGTV